MLLLTFTAALMATNAATVTERDPDATTSRTAQPPKPGPEHRRLDVFVGTWDTQGRTKASPSGPPAKIVGTDSYEWLDGGFFLVHRVDVRIGAEQVTGLEIIGYDASSQTYRTHAFDSQGSYGAYQATVHNGVWTFMGASERATVVVSDTGNTMTITWERSTDGLSWLHWMDVTLARKA